MILDMVLIVKNKILEFMKNVSLEMSILATVDFLPSHPFPSHQYSGLFCRPVKCLKLTKMAYLLGKPINQKIDIYLIYRKN